MPSKSKSQQRFFGMVDAYKKGELKHPSKEIKDAADGMTKKQVKDFASTKHKGLPEEVGKNVVRLKESDLRRIVKECVNRILFENSTDIDSDNYYGGGLPSNYNREDPPEQNPINMTYIGNQTKELTKLIEALYGIANNSDEDTNWLYTALHHLENGEKVLKAFIKMKTN